MYEDLPRVSQMNIRMDWLAKFTAAGVKQDNSFQVPNASSHCLGFLPVDVHNQNAPHKLGNTLYTLSANKTIHEW